MRVAAVIPNWNGAHLLRQLFPTITAQTYAFDSIIVVDNGSSDDSIHVSETFGATVIRFATNRGFAPAINAGFAAAAADLVAVLNNDVELHATWLERLTTVLSDEAISFASGKTVSSRNVHRIDGTFDAICRGATALRCGSGRPDGPFWETPRRVQFAPFTALVIRPEVFRRVGGLDEAFESYLEDVDFGLRCASYGYTGWYEPGAVATHRGSATLGAWHPGSVRNIARNQVLIVARHYDSRALFKYGWPIAIAQLLWGVIAIRRGAAKAWIAGKLEGFRLFRSLRGSGHPHLDQVIEASERTLLDVQRSTGFDLYWRLYFAVTTRLGKN
jgi:GT2 family glycosyltransferase